MVCGSIVDGAVDDTSLLTGASVGSLGSTALVVVGALDTASSVGITVGSLLVVG